MNKLFKMNSWSWSTHKQGQDPFFVKQLTLNHHFHITFAMLLESDKIEDDLDQIKNVTHPEPETN